MTDTSISYTTQTPKLDLDSREGSGIELGANTRLSWAARTDIGLVRGHNEDSFLVRAPLFGVCDGMGGHAAGEVASSIAVQTIAQQAPLTPDDGLLGAAIEAANEAVMKGASEGIGKPGMGCTASCCIIDGTQMAVAHVGDSRIYLLRQGTLVRVTHDHSYVEELVEAGQITADEARVHPSRSVITRALGSDPDMYADHFMLDVERGDRIIVCSDGLSSMIPDSAIEDLAVSTSTPLACTDALITAALTEGGHDNVSVITIDIVNDGTEEAHRRQRRRGILAWALAFVIVLALASVVLALIINNSWYMSIYAGKVAIYQGMEGQIAGFSLSHLEQETDINITDLPETTQHQLSDGISFDSLESAQATVEAYRTQIEEERAKANETATNAQSDSQTGQVGSVFGDAGPEATSTEAAATEAAQDTAQAQGGE